MSLFSCRYPLLQAPMAGVQDSRLAIAIAEAGGLGALPCAMWDLEKIRSEVGIFRKAIRAPINLNYFCHLMPEEPSFESWFKELAPYFAEYGVEMKVDHSGLRRPFDEANCALLEELRPEFVSFHFGLPETRLWERVKSSGAKTLATATSLREARDLEQRGCDFIILQGIEAGGHRGMYLETDLHEQKTAWALLEECRKEIRKPLIIAGGIRQAEDVEKALKLGASAVQVGTAFLLADEITVSPAHRQALRLGGKTEVTNVLTGRPARGLVNRLMKDLGLVTEKVPPFPYAGSALSGLKKAAEAKGSTDFSTLWAGTGIGESEALPAREILAKLIPASLK